METKNVLITETLEKTMAQMPNVFTSNQFNKQAIKNGYPESILKHKGLASFIRKYATNDYEFSKTWTKIKKDKLESDNISIDDMIKILKSKGYKIMKPINEWIEC